MDLSPDAVAVIGFVVLFALMLLRVPVGMAMGLVGVTGFGYLVGSGPALKMVGQTSMRIVTDYTFGVIPMFLLMGAFVSRSGMSRELFHAANTLRRPSAWRAGYRHHRRLRRVRGDQRLVGGDGGDLLDRCLSGNAALRLSAVLRHRRDRRGRHAGGDVSAIHRAGGVWADHATGYRQTVHRRCAAGVARGVDVHGDDRHHRPGASALPAGGAAQLLGRAPGCGARRLGASGLVRVRDRRAVRRAVHPDRGGWHGRGRRVPDQRRTAEAVARGHPRILAAGDAHRGGGVHRADRRHPVRLFPHGDADAAECDGVHHRAGHGTLRRIGRDHADVLGAGLPDGCDGDDHPDGADHLSR